MSSEVERYLYYPEMAPRRVYNIDLLKVLAVFLIGIGLVGLYYAASMSPAPVYRVRDLIGNFFLNYATVMVEGRIVEPVRLDVQTGGRLRLTIYIVDEEGVEPFTIFVYDPVASQLMSSDRFVEFGDFVRLIIQLRVREDFTYGIIQDVSHVFLIERLAEEPINVTSLRGVEQFKYVCSEGTVTSPRNVSAGLLLDLATPGGQVTVLVPRTFNYRFSNREEFSDMWIALNTPGSLVRICGLVYYYRGTSPEIVPLKLEDISIKTYIEVREVEIPALGDFIGEVVGVTGYFTGLRYESDTRLYLVSISDDQGNVVIATASREIVNVSINPWVVGISSQIRVIGVVQSSERISASILEIIDPVLPLNTTSVEVVLKQPHGSIVVLWGVKVVYSSVTSGGSWLIDVSDGVSTIRIFIPSSVARGIATNPPPLGSYVAIAGYRDIYGTTEEIVVYTENGLIVLMEVPPTPPEQPRYTSIRLNELGNYVNSNVSVKGELVAIRYSSAEWIYYVEIREGDLRVNATMSRDLIVNIDPWNAGPGTILMVNGTVKSGVLINAHSVTILVSSNTTILTIKEALEKPLGIPVAIVNATVVGFRATSRNDWQINITDESGLIILVFIPRSVVAELGLAQPTIGSRISVAGYRDVYAGIQEVVIYSKIGYRPE